MFIGMGSFAFLSVYIPELKFEHFRLVEQHLNSSWNFTLLVELLEGDPVLRQPLLKRPWDTDFCNSLEWYQKNNVELIYPTHPWYPPDYFQLERPPLFLSLQGSPAWVGMPTLAIVGSRDPSPSGLTWMDEHLSGLIVDLGLITISGGARGIDQRCHSLSLRGGMPTVVMLPSGLNAVYPWQLAKWKDPVIEAGGCFVSQFAPNQAMRKFHFRRRNQLIAQMADVLLVVEASRKSGSVMTARLAMEREKPVCVVPGHPTEAKGLGVLDLLFDGAQPVRDGSDIKQIYHSLHISCGDGTNHLQLQKARLETTWQ